MIITVSISKFRQNIADYLAKAKEGHTIILKDEKKDQQVVQLTEKKSFNPQTFGQALEATSGVFTAENHPEWKTKKNVEDWVRKVRLASDRKF